MSLKPAAVRKKTFTQKEIGIALNNAIVHTLKPSSLKEIDPVRLRQLREYTLAVLKPTEKHMEGGLLCPEELVAVLSIGALFIQMKHVMKTTKMPLGGQAFDLMDEPAEAETV